MYYGYIMPKNYTAPGSLTTPNSASLPMVSIIGSTQVRPEIHDVLAGSSTAPADHSGRFSIYRVSTVGTPTSSAAANSFDANDPASECLVKMGPFTSTPPTIGVLLLQWAQLQKGTFRFSARPGCELKGPYLANNGLALYNPQVDVAFLYDFTIQFYE